MIDLLKILYDWFIFLAPYVACFCFGSGISFYKCSKDLGHIMKVQKESDKKTEKLYSIVDKLLRDKK